MGKTENLLNINPEKYTTGTIAVQLDKAIKNGDVLVSKDNRVNIYATLKDGNVVNFSSKTIDGKPVKGVLYQNAKGVKRCLFCIDTGDGYIVCHQVPCPPKEPLDGPPSGESMKIIQY